MPSRNSGNRLGVRSWLVDHASHGNPAFRYGCSIFDWLLAKDHTSKRQRSKVRLYEIAVHARET